MLQETDSARPCAPEDSPPRTAPRQPPFCLTFIILFIHSASNLWSECTNNYFPHEQLFCYVVFVVKFCYFAFIVVVICVTMSRNATGPPGSQCLFCERSTAPRMGGCRPRPQLRSYELTEEYLTDNPHVQAYSHHQLGAREVSTKYFLRCSMILIRYCNEYMYWK